MKASLLTLLAALLVLQVVLANKANANEVWSGEFFAETSDGVELGFVATYPKESAECMRQIVRDIVVEVDHDTFTSNVAMYKGLTFALGRKECATN